MLERNARELLKRNISQSMAHASGRSVMDHGVNQWDLVANILVDGVEQIIKAELQGKPRTTGDSYDTDGG